MAWGRNSRRGGGGGGRGRGGSTREFEKLASVSLWENDGGRSGPVLVGSLQDEDGNEIGRISLWEGTSEHSKAPVLTGSITREKGSGRRKQPRRAPEPEEYDEPEEFDDDIPF